MANDRYTIQCRDRELDLRDGAKVMGILNTTPDSFFDGGLSGNGSGPENTGHAVERAMSMIEKGAEIIDVGGESTRPGAETVDAAEEIRRTIPVIRELRGTSDVLISIDTYKAVVAEEALAAGASIVNDISGFRFDPDIAAVAARYRAAVILMHTPERPDAMDWSHRTAGAATDIVPVVRESLRKATETAERHGITNIILDPGFGFGKSVEENFRLLGRLQEFGELGRPLLAGLSRKSFLGEAIRRPGGGLPSPEMRLSATVAASAIAVLNGARILRAHDAQEAAHAAAVASRVKTAGAVPPPVS